MQDNGKIKGPGRTRAFFLILLLLIVLFPTLIFLRCNIPTARNSQKDEQNLIAGSKTDDDIFFAIFLIPLLSHCTMLLSALLIKAYLLAMQICLLYFL
jgi:hypothetical protein